jgi:membrane fusion protein, heavy metal efflux system
MGRKANPKAQAMPRKRRDACRASPRPFAFIVRVCDGFAVRFLRALNLPRWAPIGVLAAVLVASACKTKTEAEPAKPAKEADVDVQLSDKALEAAHLVMGKPKMTPRRSSVAVTGAIDFVPSRVARIGPSIGGRIGAVMVTAGQHVKRGATLISLDSVDAGRARADFLSAKSRLAQAEVELEREKRLMAGGASSERAVMQAETERNLAQNEVRASEARLRTLGTGSANGGIALTTPIDGTVLEVKARLGQPVGATDTLVVVGEIDPVWLKVDIYERDFSRVHLGDDVKVTTVAYPDRVFEGKVDLLGTVVDPDRRVVEARIVLGNTDAALRPGMTATARILGDPGLAAAPKDDAGNAPSAPMVTTVPRTALQIIDGQPYLFLEKEKGKFELRPVERGSDLDAEVEIARGLKGDENVVVDGGFILKSELLKEQMGTND